MAFESDSEWKSLLDQMLTRWTGNDPQRLVDYYDKDCVYSDPTGTYYGHKQLLPYLKKLLSRNPNWVWTCKHKGFYPHKDTINNIKMFTFQWIAIIPTDNGKLRCTGIDIIGFDKRSKLIKINHVWFNADGNYHKWLKLTMRKSKL